MEPEEEKEDKFDEIDHCLHMLRNVELGHNGTNSEDSDNLCTLEQFELRIILSNKSSAKERNKVENSPDRRDVLA